MWRELQLAASAIMPTLGWSFGRHHHGAFLGLLTLFRRRHERRRGTLKRALQLVYVI
jgi:hypothetical protein